MGGVGRICHGVWVVISMLFVFLLNVWGAENFTQGVYSFSDFISINGLMDIPLEGGSYTWSNSLFGSRIDRFLFSSEWEEHYPNIHKKRLVRVLSDHFPISLEGSDICKGRKPFLF